MRKNNTVSPMMQKVIETIAGFGALTTQAVALTVGINAGAARAFIASGRRAGLLEKGQKGLYTITAEGQTAAGMPHSVWSYLCRVTNANVNHLYACAVAAAGVGRRYDCELVGERAMRRMEWARKRGIASATMKGKRFHVRLPRLHRADFTAILGNGVLVAFEIECSRKSWRILLAIIRAWVKCNRVGYVVYAIPREARCVRVDVERAIRKLGPVAQEKILLVWLEDLLEDAPLPELDRVFNGQ